MGSKGKGTRAERELLHMFWETGTWAAIRSPGSGSTPLPSPDILAGDGKKRYLAIECKSLKEKRKYFDQDEINQLLEFSKKFGAEPRVAVRFDKVGWYFFPPYELIKGKKNFVVSMKHAEKKGLNFNELIGVFRQSKLNF